jgi:flavin-dependent dehydrogenase
VDLDFDVIVIGGGAAGLFCARTAGYRGRRVAVLDRPALGGVRAGPPRGGVGREGGVDGREGRV